MKFTSQRMKFLHSIDGVNYSLDFFFREYIRTNIRREIIHPRFTEQAMFYQVLYNFSYYLI